MWLGLSEQWWMQLWSGVIGASVAAGISVLVALIVVNKTNSHQRHLADIALASQKESDRQALEQQRSALQLQLEEQRKDAASERRLALRTQVLAAAQHATHTHRDGLDAIHSAMRDVHEACIKWRLEASDPALNKELMAWPTFLYLLSSDVFMAIQKGDKDAESVAFERLAAATGTLTYVATAWPASLDEAAVVKSLRRTRLASDGEPDKVVGNG